MPTYDYGCAACGNRFEVFERMSARGRRPCPKCRKGARRAMSAPGGFIFKGGGFYKTEYRNGAAKPKAEEKGGPAPGCDSPKPGACKTDGSASTGKTD